MQLEIFTTGKEKVYDSAAVSGGTLDWNLSDQQGQRMAEGEYPYTLRMLRMKHTRSEELSNCREVSPEMRILDFHGLIRNTMKDH
jgi:hypothetical protein